MKNEAVFIGINVSRTHPDKNYIQLKSDKAVKLFNLVESIPVTIEPSTSATEGMGGSTISSTISTTTSKPRKPSNEKSPLPLILAIVIPIVVIAVIAAFVLYQYTMKKEPTTSVTVESAPTNKPELPNTIKPTVESKPTNKLKKPITVKPTVVAKKPQQLKSKL